MKTRCLLGLDAVSLGESKLLLGCVCVFVCVLVCVCVCVCGRNNGMLHCFPPRRVIPSELVLIRLIVGGPAVHLLFIVPPRNLLEL